MDNNIYSRIYKEFQSAKVSDTDNNPNSYLLQ